MSARLTMLTALICCLWFDSAITQQTSIHEPNSSITTVDPNWALPGSTLWVTITGQDTHFQQGSSSIWLEQASSTIFADYANVQTELIVAAHFSIPAWAGVGSWHLSVRDPGYPTTTLWNGFSIYATPEIVSIAPSSAAAGSDLWVTITGAHTFFGMGSSTSAWLELFSPVIHIGATEVNVLDQYNLAAHFQIPPDTPPGWLNVATGTTGYPSPKCWGCFLVYEAPILTDISPDRAARGDSLWVTISGVHTHFGVMSSTLVWLEKAGSRLSASSVIAYQPLLVSALFEIPEMVSLGDWSVWVNDFIDPPLALTDGFSVFAVCGDHDGSGAFNIADVVTIINYIFGGGVAPVDIFRGDIDCSGDVDIADAVYFLNFIFASGLPPCAGCR